MRLRFLLFGFFILRSTSFADGIQCLDGSPSNTFFRDTIRNSKELMIKDFRESSAYKVSEGRLGCLLGNCEATPNALSLRDEVTEIPKECIRASLKRQVSQNSIECRRQPDGNWGYIEHGKRSKSAPCFEDTTVDYVHHVTNKVLSCFQGLELKNGAQVSIDPKLIFAKLNNEGGFNFTFSYKGGVGAGQLTKWSVQEMNVLDPKTTKGRVVPGNGRFILDAILKSDQSACKGLAPIIRNDMKFKYWSPRMPNCEWLSLETGLARNLIYSVGYLTFLKHEIVERELKRRGPAAYKDAELRDLLNLIAYGPRGSNRALTLIRTLGMNSSSNSVAYLKQQLKHELYLMQTEEKKYEARKFAGDSCRLL